VRLGLVLLVVERLLHLFLHGLHLLLDLIQVIEELLLVRHPLIKPALTQQLPLVQDILVVLLHRLYFLIEQGFCLLFTTTML
jgi:hypothetical protein